LARPLRREIRNSAAESPDRIITSSVGESPNNQSAMSELQTTNATRVLLEKAQLAMTCLLLLGSVAYVGKQMAIDEQHGRMLEGIANDIGIMKERNADANAQIKVISERVSQVEKRLERIEQRQ
jgi:flagellar capping protein FliD